MELDQLAAFECAAREGNFTRAAEVLNLTQPAVSMRVSQLEAELGGPLFERRGRMLHLTPLGTTFLPYAQRILTLKADGIQAARALQQGKIGAVKIAAPAPFVLSFLIEVLGQFRQAHPNADILIRERNKTTILDMLDTREVVLGVVNAPVFDKQFVQLAHLYDPIHIVVAPTHPLARHLDSPLPMTALYEHTIFRVSLFPQMTAFVDTLVEAARQSHGGAVIAVPMVMAYELVIKGQGITFLPQTYIQRALDAGQLVTLPLAEMPALYSQPLLIALKDRQLDPMHLAFADTFRRALHHLRET